MSATKKQAKADTHGGFKDLKTRKSPKGGSPTLTINPSLVAALNNTSSSGSGGGGGKEPSIGNITITKTTDGSSPNLFNACLGGG